MRPDIDILLARYFAGEATGREQVHLEQWIAESDENQAYFDRLTNIFEQTIDLPEPPPKPNTQHALLNFESYMQASSEQEKKPDKQRSRSIGYYYWVAAAACTALLISLSIVRFSNRATRPIELIATTSPTQFTLPDSTKVTLSANSQLNYRNDFGTNRKAVELVGEASFAVSNTDSEKKLLVFAGETIIEDIGTVFKVNAFPDSTRVVVSVTEGKVHVYTKTNNGVLIEANEEATFDNLTRTFTKRQLPITLIMNLHFEFNSTSLREVAELLDKAYNVKIVFGDKSIADRRITVAFDNEDIDLIIGIISETLDIDVKKNQTIYTLF